MEYIFGTENDKETLRTHSDEHTDLTGFCQTVREFPNEKITDHFHVVKKIRSKNGADGSAYDWYEIDRHYREIDKTIAVKRVSDKNTADIDYISMMAGIDLPEEDRDE